SFLIPPSSAYASCISPPFAKSLSLICSQHSIDHLPPRHTSSPHPLPAHRVTNQPPTLPEAFSPRSHLHVCTAAENAPTHGGYYIEEHRTAKTHQRRPSRHRQ